MCNERPGDALCKHYGFEMGALHRFGAQLLSSMELAPELRSFLECVLTDCFLAARMQEFSTRVQMSVFLACEPGAALRKRLRCRRKVSDLSYMRDAMLWDWTTLAEPLAHCTISIPLRRWGGVSVDFLEKSYSTLAKRLSLGTFMLGVALSFVAPFLDPDIDVFLRAEDDGSGQLVRYYQKLGFESKGNSRDMRGNMRIVLSRCVEGVTTASETPTKQR